MSSGSEGKAPEAASRSISGQGTSTTASSAPGVDDKLLNALAEKLGPQLLRQLKRWQRPSDGQAGPKSQRQKRKAQAAAASTDSAIERAAWGLQRGRQVMAFEGRYIGTSGIACMSVLYVAGTQPPQPPFCRRLRAC